MDKVLFSYSTYGEAHEDGQRTLDQLRPDEFPAIVEWGEEEHIATYEEGEGNIYVLYCDGSSGIIEGNGSDFVVVATNCTIQVRGKVE